MRDAEKEAARALEGKKAAEVHAAQLQAAHEAAAAKAEAERARDAASLRAMTAQYVFHPCSELESRA